MRITLLLVSAALLGAAAYVLEKDFKDAPIKKLAMPTFHLRMFNRKMDKHRDLGRKDVEDVDSSASEEIGDYDDLFDDEPIDMEKRLYVNRGGFRPSKRSMAIGRAGMRPGKRAFAQIRGKKSHLDFPESYSLDRFAYIDA